MSRTQTTRPPPTRAPIRGPQAPVAARPIQTNAVARKPPTSATRVPAPRQPQQPSALANVATNAASTVTATAANAASPNWINRAVQSQVANVGNYASGFVYSIGNGVNKVGDGIGGSITNTTRYWGQGVAGYGNNIKDQVGVGGPRVSTAGNPLALAGVGGGQGAVPSAKSGKGTRGGAGNPLGI
ncbi:hypothetical protein B0A50_07239 [Salinomyces thailandicus]|uniref:Uncharacterized protein n=1 Tax=Salinomyces thailandicus TaxID=706561 RepID=A0A4U0TM32_9PEZI|nr:hypothetical protein B0A50_07239 [Salinomyces thailandica]